MGKPSGVAERFETPAARKPTALEVINVFSINVRLEMGVILICWLLIVAWRPARGLSCLVSGRRYNRI